MESNGKQNTTERKELLETMYTTMQVLSWESHKQATEVMENFGLTLPQGVVLLTLDGFGGRAKMSDLIKVIQLSGGTLTGIIDRLIVAELVGRERVEDDRRVVYVSLTEAGRGKIQAIQHYQKVQLDMATSIFNNKELELFNALLTRFLDATGISPEVVQNYSNYAKHTDLADYSSAFKKES